MTMTQDARYRMNEIIEQAAEKRAEMIESFIVAYLQRTGKSMEDLELCEQETFADGKVTIRWWLQPRGLST